MVADQEDDTILGDFLQNQPFSTSRKMGDFGRKQVWFDKKTKFDPRHIHHRDRFGGGSIIV